MKPVLFVIGLLGTLTACTFQSSPTVANASVPDATITKLLAVIRPSEGEDPFATIPWQTSLWEARVLAAKLGKPILLWEMDGHPLGCG